MRRFADRFCEAAATCASMGELRELIVAAAGKLGFSYVALLHHASLRSTGRRYIRLDNYPAEWASELVEKGLVVDDPVHLACRRVNCAFRWSDLESLALIGPRQKMILERSRHHGLGDGLTVPVNVPGEPSGSCSFATRVGVGLPEHQFLCAELLGLHAFEAARRISNSPRERQRPHLSRREVQCLALVAAGKSDWEIARILGISNETARQYVKRARAAYDVVTRTQLVVLGLRDAWLSFEDAIDPLL